MRPSHARPLRVLAGLSLSASSRAMKMRRRVAASVLLVAVLAASGCGDKVIGPQPASPSSAQVVLDPSRLLALDPIRLFIREQQIPKPQSYHVVARLASGRVTFFRLDYDEIHHDLAGNWYSIAYGVKYDRKIGWIVFSEQPPRQGVTMYNPAASDSELYSQGTWGVLDGSDHWLFACGFIPMLAGSAGTPEATLLTIATSHLTAHIGWLLLGNPTARGSRDILTVLANVPVRDAYDPMLQVRSRARELLQALG